MICANPDIVVQRGDQLIYCAGALARLYEEMGGKVVMAGKPHAPIYDLARSEMASAGVASPRILVIGDGAPTDLKGGNAQGLDVLFILGGIHAADLCDDAGEPSTHRIDDFLQREGVSATYALAGLRW
jgi:ribonucleotide monophosphatase NagD (HAD superfamily)